MIVFRRLFLFATIIGFVLAPANAVRSAEIVHDDYGVDLSRFADIHRPKSKWLEPDSPWHPYLKRRFEDGLSTEDRQLSRSRQAVGECETVLTLELKGFLALYPNVKINLLDPDTKRVFETEIVPAVSPDYKRCRAWADLIAVVETEKRRWNLVGFGRGSLPSVFLLSRRSDAHPDLARMERIAATFLSLAVCDQYEPAYGDLVYLQADLGVLYLGYEELLYITQQAKRAGINAAAIEPLVRRAERRVDRYRLRDGVVRVPRDAFRSGAMLFAPQWMSELCRQEE